MMPFQRARLCLLLSFLLPIAAVAQSQNGSITGTVTDPSGALVPNVDVTLTSAERGESSTVKTGTDGLYSFPNVIPGTYEIRATASGFRPYVQTGLTLSIKQFVRVDISLAVGDAAQTVEVQANASPLNFDNAVRQEGVTPETVNELPLVVAGGPRNSAQFAVLLPGVTTGGSNSAFDARINGGLQSGDEAIMDGVSMQEGTMAQSGMVAFADYRMTPDMISEFRVLTSSYDPEYGVSTGAQIIAVTKSGTSTLHGGLFEYLRNKDLNALQFTDDRQPGDQRPKDNEHEFGGYIGGPVKLPFISRYIYNDKTKTFFYTDIESFRIVGGNNRPTLSIPSLQERQGDFSDWKDASGNLIPIYDPATTRQNPNYNSALPEGPNNLPYLRDQFMGCNGNQPNVICPNRISPLAQAYFKYLPNPTSPGPLNNYLVPQPVPDSILADANHYLIKLDEYLGERDHIAGTIWRQRTPKKFACTLPIQICNGTFSQPQDSWVNRLNWDHTFSPTLLNHFAFGYLNRNEGYGSIDYKYADAVPQIAGVASHNYPPAMNFGNGFESFGNNSGLSTGNKTTRPSNIGNDVLTWVKGSHTLKGGAEVRILGQNFHNNGNESGTFNFSSGETGLNGLNSGSSMASFLLGAVDNGNVNVQNVSSWYARQRAFTFFGGDTWKVTQKLTLNYGVRYDNFTPTYEKYNRFSFFSFAHNPYAGNLPGSLAFAGNKWGQASAGVRYPEQHWNGGIAPRLGIAYAVNDRTVVRAGYGLFYTQAFYPGWGGGMSLDGFNANPSFSSSLGGIQPAFYLDQGFPGFNSAPQINAGYDNGKSLLYRPKDANRLSNSQQWNFTIERQVGKNIALNVAYVGSKGTRLPSQILPINALNPSLLSMGSALNTDFLPNQQTLNGVSQPYPGWAQQLIDAGCAPSVAQALRPFPQYCDGLAGLNENLGNSTFHSFQLKAEKRFSNGLYFLGTYMWSKLITSAAGNTQAPNSAGNGGQSGVISPFQLSRNKALSPDDVPNSFSLAAIYDLPFGRGKQFLSSGGGLLNALVGGWSVSTTIKLSSGVPFFFRDNTNCNVPGAFVAGCIPGVLPGANPFLQSKSNFDTHKPLFNVNSFESANSFNFYLGKGERVTNYRNFGYKNEDLAIEKIIPITERFKFKLRGEAFNVWNNHYFTQGGIVGQDFPFNNDIGSPSFGLWNGTVTSPRNIQLVGRFEF